MEVPGVTRSRLIRELAELSPEYSSCPGDTGRGSRYHSLSALARTVVRTGRGTLHLPMATGSPMAAVQARLTCCESLARAGTPPPAERGGRVCSEKPELSKTTSATVGGKRSRSLIGYRKAAVKGRQVGYRWGCERCNPLPVSPRARTVGVVTD